MSENTEHREDEAARTPDDTSGHMYMDGQPGFRDGEPTAPKTHHADDDEDDTSGHVYMDGQPGFSGAINIDPDLPS